MDRLGNAVAAATSASTPRQQALSTSTKTHPSSTNAAVAPAGQGGGFISEPLSRILKQYEMSAMNSLKGPAATIATPQQPAANQGGPVPPVVLVARQLRAFSVQSRGH